MKKVSYAPKKCPDKLLPNFDMRASIQKLLLLSGRHLCWHKFLSLGNFFNCATYPDWQWTSVPNQDGASAIGYHSYHCPIIGQY